MANKVLFEVALTDYDDVDVEGVGTLREEGNKVYKWVENISASAALVAGQPVCYDVSLAATPAAMFQGVLQAEAAADIEFFAGIAMSAIPFGEYGWIQVQGVSITALCINSDSVAVAAGDTLILVSAEVALSLGAAGGGVFNPNPAVAISSQASGITVAVAGSVMLNCMR